MATQPQNFKKVKNVLRLVCIPALTSSVISLIAYLKGLLVALKAKDRVLNVTLRYLTIPVHLLSGFVYQARHNPEHS